MITDPDWIIQKINEWEERLTLAQHEFDLALQNRAELEIRTYRQWLKKLKQEKRHHE